MFGQKAVKRVESMEVDEAPPFEEGFSLEELGAAYANAIGQATGQSTETATTLDASAGDMSSMGLAPQEETLAPPTATESDGVPVTPETILEAMLFLGSNNNRPLSIDKLTEIFRGVTVAVLDEAVDRLNELYRKNDRAMEIIREPGGYRMQLAQDLHTVRDRFYSRVKETQLTQSAIDCLALVAYQPGITRDEIEKQWNQPASNMLSMLVRKGLLRLDRESSGAAGTHARYFTTQRFLEVIGLDSLEDLPLAEEI